MRTAEAVTDIITLIASVVNMKGNNMNVLNHNNLVGPNEVISIALTYNNNFISDIETVKAIKQAVNEHCTESDKKDRIWFNACLCVALFHAGRIQGIREERLRRNQQREHNQA